MLRRSFSSSSKDVVLDVIGGRLLACCIIFWSCSFVGAESVFLCSPDQDSNTLYGKIGPDAVVVNYTYELEVLLVQAVSSLSLQQDDDVSDVILPALEISFARFVLMELFPASCNSDKASTSIEGIVGLSTLPIDVVRRNNDTSGDDIMIPPATEQTETTVNDTNVVNETVLNEMDATVDEANATTDTIVTIRNETTVETTNTATVEETNATVVEEANTTLAVTSETIEPQTKKFLDVLSAVVDRNLTEDVLNTTTNNQTTNMMNFLNTVGILNNEGSNGTTTVRSSPCSDAKDPIANACFVIDGSLTVYWDEAVVSQDFAIVIKELLRKIMQDEAFLASTHGSIVRVGMYQQDDGLRNTQEGDSQNGFVTWVENLVSPFVEKMGSNSSFRYIIIFAPLILLCVCMGCCAFCSKRGADSSKDSSSKKKKGGGNDGIRDLEVGGDSSDDDDSEESDDGDESDSGNDDDDTDDEHDDDDEEDYSEEESDDE
eukprot:CAMPEP_0119022696 /NCGR_PEP_ID=MMETSP1176-20130426/28561_1 /TAXON_ID=265551 /ORGANISM="Synedropsis recta cf, Strain CCMP1620" /LENGTH=488 /DNA_ID=CAMNT_0006977621 /DNA_START=78 /DNA_END=1544 /DNA_ORIENTATION=+